MAPGSLLLLRELRRVPQRGRLCGSKTSLQEQRGEVSPGIKAARIGSSFQAWPHAPSSSAPAQGSAHARQKSSQAPPRPCPQLRGARVTHLVLTSAPNTSPDLHLLLPKAEPTTQPLLMADVCLSIKGPSALSVLDLCPAPTPSSCTSSVPTPCL